MIGSFIFLALIYIGGCFIFSITYYALNLFVNFIFIIFGLSYAEWALKTLPMWSQNLIGALAVAVTLYVGYRVLKKWFAYAQTLPTPEVKPEPEKEEPYFAFNWKRAILGKIFLGDLGFFLFGFNKNPKYKGDDIKFI